MIRFFACCLALLLFAFPAWSQTISVPSTPSGVAPQKSLGIAEVVSAVRDELEKSRSMLQEKGLEAMLFADEFELELQFVVKKTTGAEGFDIEVLGVGFGVDGKNLSETSEVQRITLKFKAREPGSKGYVEAPGVWFDLNQPIGPVGVGQVPPPHREIVFNDDEFERQMWTDYLRGVVPP